MLRTIIGQVGAREAIGYDKRMAGLLMDIMGDLNSGKLDAHAKYEYRMAVWAVEGEVMANKSVNCDEVAYDLAMGACHQVWMVLNEIIV